MARKRRTTEPQKPRPITSPPLRPASLSPPPEKKKHARSALAAAPPRRPNPLFKAKRILRENELQYLIEWDGRDSKTARPYEPSLHPKACANRALVAAWEHDLAGEEWPTRGIVAENEYYYKISWADDAKTGEVYKDTWEPKAYASECIIHEWKQRRAEGAVAAAALTDEEGTPPKTKLDHGDEHGSPLHALP